MNEFDRQIETVGGEELRSVAIETLQVNVGLRCNQRCAHCHVSASPERSEMMTWPTMELVLAAAASVDCRLVDITGGAPELNPDEGVWKLAKQTLANGRPDTQDELRRHLRASLNQIRRSPQRLRGCVRQSELSLFLPEA